MPVTLAFLEFMTPDLPAAVEGGCRAVRIVPVFLGQGGHLRQDLPALVKAIQARHPEIAVDVAMAVGEDDSVLDRMADVSVAGIETG